MTPELSLYLLQAATIFGVFTLLFRALLSRETFYQLNRVVLLAIPVLAFALPLIQTQGWQEQVPLPAVVDLPLRPSLSEDGTVNDSPPPAQQPVATETKNAGKRIAWAGWFKMAYLIGLAIFGGRLIIQLTSLLYTIGRTPQENRNGIRIVSLDRDLSPYSFFKWIVINEKKYSPDVYREIIAHESIHVREGHSFDILLAELLLVVFWFNPFAWMYRQLLEANIEYTTDRKMLTHGINKKNYQYNLLKVCIPNFPLSLSTNYNQSIIKNRIKMMNAKQSSLQSSWKYLLYIPLVCFFAITFNQLPVSANSVKGIDLAIADGADYLYILIPRTATPTDIRKVQDEALEYGANLIVEEYQTNDEGVITNLSIKCTFDNEENRTGIVSFKPSPNSTKVLPYPVLIQRNLKKGNNGFELSFLEIENYHQLITTIEQSIVLVAGERADLDYLKSMEEDIHRFSKLEKEIMAKGKAKLATAEDQEEPCCNNHNSTVTFPVNGEAKLLPKIKKYISSRGKEADYEMGGFPASAADLENYRTIQEVKIIEKFEPLLDEEGSVIGKKDHQVTVSIRRRSN